jgi:hypothetical protein
MQVLATALVMVVLLAASPVGAWYTNRHPAVRNDTWGGALGFLLSWLGFVLAVAYCAWRARRSRATDDRLARSVGQG